MLEPDGWHCCGLPVRDGEGREPRRTRSKIWRGSGSPTLDAMWRRPMRRGPVIFVSSGVGGQLTGVEGLLAQGSDRS